MADIRQSIEEFYLRYIESINKRDMATYDRSFELPFILLNGDHGVTIYSSHEEHKSSYLKMFRDLEIRGWANTKVTKLGALSAGKDHALLFSEITRYRGDGSKLESKSFCYTIRRSDQSWKIMTTLRLDGELPEFCKPPSHRP